MFKRLSEDVEDRKKQNRISRDEKQCLRWRIHCMVLKTDYTV